MAFPDSIDLIKKIEASRGSRVISYITSEREPRNMFATKIATDVLELLYEHLTEFGKNKIPKITLFLNSNGGNLDAPWPIVNLIREFCKVFEVIVPFAGRSAATLIALGADKIIMTPISQLSPVDPEGTFKHKGEEIKIGVEDVFGYLDFARDKVGLDEQESLTEILKILSDDNIPPQILGSVNRTLSLIRALSENLLKLHIKDISKQKQIDQIVNNMTRELFSHSHFIGRKEAKEFVGFKDIIVYADTEIWEHSDSLLKKYFTFMEEKSVFNPLEKLGDKTEVIYEANRGVLESSKFCHIFEGKYKIKKEDSRISIEPIYQGWKRYEREAE